MEYSTEDVTQDLVHDEGVRYFVYDDATGKPIVKGSTVYGNPTIGVGRNLASVGLRPTEIPFLLDNDISTAKEALQKALPWFSVVDGNRQEVLVEMCFNMGVQGLLYFTKMLRALRNGEFGIAANEMLDSAWAQQVGKRAERLAQKIRSGG